MFSRHQILFPAIFVTVFSVVLFFSLKLFQHHLAVMTFIVFIISFLLSVCLYQVVHNFLAYTYRAAPKNSDSVLITGGSSGIGLEMAKLFVRDQFPIIILCSNDGKEKVASAIEILDNINQCSQSKSKIIHIHKDLSKPNAPEELFNELAENKIIVTHLVNNAGFGVVGKFVNLPIKVQLDMLQVNVTALSHLAYLFGAEMVKRKIKGKILNVSSAASFQPGPGWIVYSASKAYVRSFSVGLSEEFRDAGIVVSTLCPGATRTPFLEKAGHTDTPLVQFFPQTTPEYVAQHAYYGLMDNHLLITPGILNKLLWWFSPLAPQDVLLKSVVMMNQGSNLSSTSPVSSTTSS